MDNKGLLEINDKKTRSKARAAYADLKVMATEEVLQLVRSDFCKPLELTVARNEDQITVAGDKVGTLAKFQLKDKKWVATEDSKMTYSEFEVYTDPKLVDELWESYTNARLDKEDALLDGLIPIEAAVEIYSRGTEIHSLVKENLSGKPAKITSTVKGVTGLINCVSNCDQVRMLTALIDALDNYQNEPKVYLYPTYKDFLTDNPFGTDKIVHALCVNYWTIVNEERCVLGTSDDEPRAQLRDIILKMGPRYTEAVRKIAGKALLTGSMFPVITLKASKIRLDLLSRPMHFVD